MGVNPIGYRPWKGARAPRAVRVWTIAYHTFRLKTKSTGFLVILILGFLSAHASFLLLGALIPHWELNASFMHDYMGSGIFAFFTILLAALVTSDLISNDIGSNSFVLYFSRPIKVEDYIAGKFSGAAMAMGLFCTIPPFVIAVVSIATQMGSDYTESFTVLLQTVLAGFFTTVVFLPLGMFMSSLTKQRSYAGVGTFMVLFVLVLVSGIFSAFNLAWDIISPISLLSFTYRIIFNLNLPEHISTGLLFTTVLSVFFVPLVLLYTRIGLKEAGK